MWVFTKNGFFSAVEHFEDSNLIHVRARFRGDLERLCGEYGILPKVACTPGNDYMYRMDFDRSEWARIISSEASGIDYDNFKDAVHDGTDRDRAYMNCWSALRNSQK
jgi:hypothetical protein